jgi:hypothetical protein
LAVIFSQTGGIQGISQNADSAAIFTAGKGVQGGCGISEALEAFVTATAMEC